MEKTKCKSCKRTQSQYEFLFGGNIIQPCNSCFIENKTITSPHKKPYRHRWLPFVTINLIKNRKLTLKEEKRILAKEKAKQRNKKYRQELKGINSFFLYNYLSTHPCVDCGETDIRVLDFDHIDTVNKKANISQLISRTNWKHLKKEIAKCEVRCANCHRIKTAKQLGWEYGRFYNK